MHLLWARTGVGRLLPLRSRPKVRRAESRASSRNGWSMNSFIPQLLHKHQFNLSKAVSQSYLSHLLFCQFPPSLFGSQQIYCMDESNKKANYSFLDKFRGRTNKINKNGINQALASNRTLLEQPQLKDENAKVRPKKLASLDPRNLSQYCEQNPSEMGDSSSSNPERRHLPPILTKRSTDVSIRSSKLDPIPLKEIKHSPQEGFVLPPSRSVSDRKPNLQRRAFGKYLKLDDDAMNHLEFLLQVDQKRAQRRSTVIFTER